MYYESAGREVQAAGSAGGSHAEGAEVSPTTEGRRGKVHLRMLYSSLNAYGWMLDTSLKKSTVFISLITEADRMEISHNFTLYFPSFKYQTPLGSKGGSEKFASSWRKLLD